MPFPFTSSGFPGREYYSAALENRRPEQTVWSGGRQPVAHPYEEQLTRLGVVSVGAAALFGAGFLQATPGRNVFSKYYLPAIRSFEEYSPGRVFRTFQLSNFFSQFSTEARSSFTIPSSFLTGTQRGAHLSSYYSRLTGQDLSAALLEQHGGLVFHQGKLFLGRNPSELGPQLLSNASVILNKRFGSSRISEGIATSLGLRGNTESIADPYSGGKSVFSRTTEIIDATGKRRLVPMQIVGAQSPLAHTGLEAHGIATAFVERFNILSRSFPAEYIPASIGKRLGKLGVDASKLHLGVRPGPAGKTLLKLAGKWGAVGGGLYFGYDLLDWSMDKAFGMGPAKLAATGYVSARLTAASASGATGLSAIPTLQEEVAPGSTNLLKLGAFPAIGALAGIGFHYLQGINLQQRLQFGKDWDIEKAAKASERVLKSFGPGHPGWVNSLGRWLRDKEIFSNVFEKKLFDRPWKVKALAGAGLGLAVVAPFIPGALIPQTSADELRKIYSGEQEVPVRRGRFWEMGRTPWEGLNTSYFRPHWYPLMMSDARDKSIYGEKKSAIEKFLLGNFTYDLERQHYYDRPYPITGTAFEDFPLIGPLLAGTIGRFVKPPLAMHEGEYLRNGEYAHLPLGFGERRAFEMGELTPGAPISPYGAKGMIGEQLYRLQEMGGLWGWLPGAIKQKITGEEGFFTQEQQLESARRMYGAEASIWDRELGGGFGAGEILRRIFPHRRREIPTYNPIRNTMPEWLPGPGERSPDFLHGDPYRKVPMGDVRLPGAGFEALHPELAGLSPEEYPDIWKFKILSDVAPYAEQTDVYKNVIAAKQRAGTLTEYEAQLYKQTIDQYKAKRNRKEFSEYGAKSLLGKYWETISHGAMTPFEFLTPISPASKLIHQQTAIEDYRNSIVYGTQNAFWQNPIKNFISPFLTSSAAAMGWRGVPGGVEQVRDIEQYFDALEYVKLTRLKEIAEANRDYGAAAEFESKRQETLVGINPYTQVYTHIYRSLPRRDRDYFSAFSAEEDPEKQREILELLPPNERGLFIARWKMNRVQAIRSMEKEGKLSEDAEAFVEEVYAESRGGGVPQDKALRNEYISTREDGESYPDWYRRTKLLPVALAGKSVPGPDWVGFHPAVNLDDIKLKLVENLGFDMHDFDLWPSDRASVARRPYINDQAVREVEPDISMSESEIRAKLRELLTSYDMDNIDISVAMFPSDRARYNVEMNITNDRSEEIREVHDRGI